MTASREAPVRRLAVWAAVLVLRFAGLLVRVVLDHGRPVSWDGALHAVALRHRAKPLIAAPRPVSVGVQVVAYTASAVAGVLLLHPRSWWLGGVAGVGALVVGHVLWVGLTALVAPDRSPRWDWAASAAGYSFPSGHTVSATLAAGLLCLGLLRTVRRAWRIPGIAVALCWAILDGVNRVYQGMHWPSDVLARWLFGTLLFLLVTGLLATERVAAWAACEPRRSPQPARR